MIIIKSLQKNFLIFVCILTLLFALISSASAGPIPEGTDFFNLEMPVVQIVHSYSDNDGLTYTYDPYEDIVEKKLTYSGEQVFPDWSRTKYGEYKIDHIEITDLTVKVTTNYWLDGQPYSSYIPSTTTDYKSYYFDSSSGSYDLGVSSYHGSAIYDPTYVGINGDSYFDLQFSESDFADGKLEDEIIADFYYGGSTPSDYILSGSSITPMSIDIGDIYDFKLNHRYLLNIYYSKNAAAPSDYAHLHIIHNYDGITVSSSAEEYDCSVISSDLVPAGQKITSEFLSERIQNLYMGHEYIYDSMTLHYEISKKYPYYDYNIDYSGYPDSFHYTETLVVGDTFDPAEHLKTVSAPAGSSGTLSDYFNENGNTLDDDTPIKILKEFCYSFYFSVVHPFIKSPITYFQNERVDMENNIDFDDSYHEFKKDIHYVLVINYQNGFPITHHYADSSDEHIFSEGKTVTYGESTNLTKWSKPDFADETYELKRIDLIESTSKLTVRHYTGGNTWDTVNQFILHSSRSYPVIPDSHLRVGKYIEFSDFRGYNIVDSDHPEHFVLYGNPDDVIKMESGNNFLNLFYQFYAPPTSYATIADLNGYLWIRWTTSVLDAWYTFEEAKSYEVHYYYEKAGIGSGYKLTYNGNGADIGSAPVDNTVYPANSYATVMLSGDLAMTTGSEFVCWNTAADSSGASYYPDDITQNKVLMDDDITLYAIWSPGIEVNHIYNLDPSGTDTVTETKYIVMDTNVDLTSWNRSIHNGVQYYVTNIEVSKNSAPDNSFDYNSDTVYCFGQGFSYIVNITYDYPNPVNYFIRYDGNGADSGLPPEDEWYTYGDPATIKDNIGQAGDLSDILVKDGYSFGGWDTWSDGTGTSYAPGYGFNIESDLYLFAVWDPLYKVVYHSNGASGNVPVDGNEYASGSSVTVKSKETLQMQGYTFKGWNTKIDGTGITYQPSSTFDIYENTDLYAQWEKEKGTNPPGPNPKPKPTPNTSGNMNPPAFEDVPAEVDSSVPPGYSGLVYPIMAVIIIAILAVLVARWQKRRKLLKTEKI